MRIPLPSALLPLLLALAVLFSAGCAGKKPAVPNDRMPRLLDEPGFVTALGKSLKKGRSGITIVAPASGLNAEDKLLARRMAEKLGVNFPEEAVEPGRIPYNANTDAMRLKYLAEALADPDTEVVWAVRGGYGSSRLLDELRRLPLDATSKKIIIGYSDMTFLHQFFQKLGWRTVHGSMFFEMANPNKDEENFRRLALLLSGETGELAYGGLEPCNKAARELAVPVGGVVTGGNLTCLAAAAGTPWAFDAKGKILFLEDVMEPGYKIDRMLTQLRSAGLLEGVRAVILGSFTQGDKNTAFALERFAEESPAPVFKTELFGHGPRNYPLIFNAPAVLAPDRDKGGSFVLRICADSLP